MTDIDTQPSDTAITSPSRRWMLIAMGAFMVTMTNAVIFVLPPLLTVIQTQYGLATLAQTTWIYTALTLGGGVGFILLPRLADLYGDRRASVLAGVLMTAGAAIPAVGDSYPTLLVGCATLGVGGAAQLLPLGFLRRGLGESGTAIGVAVLVVATGLGIVVGMIGGGYVVEHLSLRGFYLILTALCVVMTVTSAAVIPQTQPAEPTARIGVVGTVWMIGWVAAILLTLTQGLVWGAAALIPLAVGIIGGVTWVRHQRRTTAAVFDVALMRSPLVTASCLCIALFAAINAAFLLLVSTYTQIIPAALQPADAYGLGLSALQTGWLMVPFAVTFLIGGIVVDRPVTAGRVTPVLLTGAVISVAGLAWLADFHDEQWQYLIGAAVMGLGCSIGYAAGFATVQRAVPEAKAGMASGVAGTFMAVGFALGTALISADLSAALVPVPGTHIEVAAKGLYGVGYWLSAALGAGVLLTMGISRVRRAPAAA